MKIGIVMTLVGMVWLGVIFNEGDKVSESFSLKPSGSAEIGMEFAGQDIGYYRIFIPEFSGTGVFVQILDDKYNVISDGIVETKMAVSYFDFEGGVYTAKISNLSDEQMNLEIEFGDTNGREMVIPGIITLVGGLMAVFAIYIKLRDYRMAQPDENIS
ncbi:MAG: hypothetical protein PVJ16_08640 [Nitrosopumilaceae archaeon]